MPPKKVVQLNEQGDTLRKDEKFDEAKQIYNEVLVLDPRNAHARMALEDIDSHRILQNRMRLKRKLQETASLVRLMEGIKDARRLEESGLLPEDLAELYLTAQRRFEDMRRRDNMITTSMKENDLRERSAAVEKLTGLVQERDDFFDPATQTVVPIAKKLEEAQQLYEQASEDHYQRLYDKYGRQLLTTPRLAANELEKHLEEPFFPKHKTNLDVLLRECRQNAEKFQKASGLAGQANQANQADDQRVEALRLWFQAIKIWPHENDWASAVDSAKQLARSSCVVKIKEFLRAARSADNSLDERERKLELVAQVISDWPQDPRPDQGGAGAAQFEDLAGEAADVRNEIARRRRLEAEFATFSKMIGNLLDEGGIGEAHDQMVAVGNIYEALNEFASLRRRVTNGRGFNEQFAEYQALVGEDPEGVETWALANLMTEEGLSGKVQELLVSARLNIAGGKVQDLLERRDLQGAGKVIRELNNRLDVMEKRLMRDRFSAEIKRIKVAKTQDAMKNLYDRAEMLRLNPQADWEALLEAMQLFQHVGGQPSDLPGQEASFTESYWQFDALEKANAVRNQLLATLLEPFHAARLIN